MTDQRAPDDPALTSVVFDFGGVLITSINHQIGAVAADHGVETHTMLGVLLGPHASDPDHPWHRAERGELPIDQIQGGLEPWASAIGVELRGDEIDRLLAPGGYTVVDEMLTEIERLRARGYRTGLLTNTFAEFRPTMQRDIDFDLFDVVIESFAVGSRKPEPAIYEATAERLGVAHGSIVYLDDFVQNLAPAEALGWSTIHVGDHEQALEQLAITLGRSGYDRN